MPREQLAPLKALDNERSSKAFYQRACAARGFAPARSTNRTPDFGEGIEDDARSMLRSLQYWAPPALVARSPMNIDI
jgi:hypothetical protein